MLMVSDEGGGIENCCGFSTLYETVMHRPQLYKKYRALWWNAGLFCENMGPLCGNVGFFGGGNGASLPYI